MNKKTLEYLSFAIIATFSFTFHAVYRTPFGISYFVCLLAYAYAYVFVCMYKRRAKDPLSWFRARALIIPSGKSYVIQITTIENEMDPPLLFYTRQSW